MTTPSTASTLAMSPNPGRPSPGCTETPFFAAALLGLLVLDHAAGAVMALTGIAILGFGIGAESGIGPYFFSRYFGMRSFGTIYGCLVSLLAISSGIFR